jgi:glycosyltransferase involved in cell wall biosynthesis
LLNDEIVMPFMNKQNGPIACVSHTFSPSLNGQALVLDRLLVGEEPGVVRISSDRYWRPINSGETIDVNVSTPWLIRKLRMLKALETLVFKVHVWHRARGIARALIQSKCSAVVACTGGDLVDLPAAILAAERVRIPCLLHYFDDYCSQWKIPNPAWSMGWMKRFGKQIEANLLPKATGVIVPNEQMQYELADRITMPSIVVRNPVNLEYYENLRRSAVRENRIPDQCWSMTYTGSIYEAQLDAVVQCALGMEALRERGIAMQLHLYTSQSEESLRALGVPASVSIHREVSSEEASALQCNSDFLLLPLAFKTRYPELIKTSSPGKLGEYLASGSPILVHAPRDSFLAQFATERRFAAVCDTPEIEQIAEKLEQLVRQPETRENLVQQALETSLLFSTEANRERYFRFVSNPR